VLPATDDTTGESVLLDPTPTTGGRVQILRLPQGLVAKDHITVAAPRQPAWELHSRTCTRQPVPVPVDLSDDPGREQSKGWRQ
jgi:hypothetical protein